jgi:putative toxin-antitoxin system antitoxin component (TIGR02293 family)
MKADTPVRQPRARESHQRNRSAVPPSRLDRAAIDARVLAVFDNARLQSKVLKLDKVELLNVWRATEAVLEGSQVKDAQPLSPLEVHDRLVVGLAGVTLLVSSAMFLTNMAEVEDYFGITFKTIKSRMEGVLDTAASEKAMRAARATMTAAEVLGDYGAAREYMHTRNFALGGATPAELVKTADGESLVLNELHAQAESGPL